MEKILCIMTKDKISLYGSFFDFLNYNSHNTKIDTKDIIRVNNELQNFSNIVKIDIIINGKKEHIKMKYLEIIRDWGSIGKQFDNEMEI